MRRRKLCFTCQESGAPGHRCAVGKAHYIEVFSDDEEEEEEEPERVSSTGTVGDDPPPAGGEDGSIDTIRGTLASLRVVPKYHDNFHIENRVGFVQWKKGHSIPIYYAHEIGP